MRLRYPILFCLVALAAPAQNDPSTHESAIRVNTRLVEVDVVVRDKNGPVRGLTKTDFTILDRGKPQTIATFGVRSANRSAPQAGAAPRRHRIESPQQTWGGGRRRHRGPLGHAEHGDAGPSLRPGTGSEVLAHAYGGGPGRAVRAGQGSEGDPGFHGRSRPSDPCRGGSVSGTIVQPFGSRPDGPGESDQ